MDDCEKYEHCHDEPNQIIPCQCAMKSMLVRDGTMLIHGETIGYCPMCGFTVFKQGFAPDAKAPIEPA